MSENTKRFMEKMKGTSFRKQIVDPYIEQMDLKQTIETQETVMRCSDKGLWVMMVFYAVGGIVGGIIAGWIWLMDYLGYFPYVTGDTDPMFVGILAIMPLMTVFGYHLALDEFKGSARKHIKKIAGVDDGKEA